jgi:cysteine-rich repeat protein
MISTSWRNSSFLLLILLALCGCAEDGTCMGFCGDGVVDPFEECDEGPLNGVAGSGCTIDCKIEIDTGLPPTLTSIQETIFTPVCVACHYQGGTGPMSLIDEDTSYGNLVDVMSFLCSGDRVEPNEPDISCLVLKVEGSNLISGQRMPPPPAPALQQEQIDLIRDWILDGAPR